MILDSRYQIARKEREMAEQNTEKVAKFSEKKVEHGYIKFTMTYPSGKVFTKYLSPENINQDHDLRNEMMAWAEDRGFVVITS